MVTTFTLLGVAFALVLAAVHLFGSHLACLGSSPRNPLLSAAAGVSVAYVFVHLLPEIQQAGAEVERAGTPVLSGVEHQVFLLSLVGFLAFYGLERFVQSAPGGGEAGETSDDVFWLHVGSFGAYNALVGYLLVTQEWAGVESLSLFVVAMALHFAINDHSLQRHHEDHYRDRGRWLLATAVIAGTGIGLVTAIDRAVLAVAFAFLAGAVIFNNVKEEFPLESHALFLPFALGAGGYAALLLLL